MEWEMRFGRIRNNVFLFYNFFVCNVCFDILLGFNIFWLTFFFKNKEITSFRFPEDTTVIFVFSSSSSLFKTLVSINKWRKNCFGASSSRVLRCFIICFSFFFFSFRFFLLIALNARQSKWDVKTVYRSRQIVNKT